jgi:hypothetical protein
MYKRTALLAALSATAAVALAACGGGGSNGVANESPSQILQATLSALRSAHSVHIKGTVGTGSGQITIDADSFSNGDVNGTVGQGGVSAQVIKIGGTDYLKGPASFWQTAGGTTAGVAALLSGRWISTPDGSAAPGIGNTFTMSALAASLSQDNGTITKGSTGTVNGQPAISITSSNGGTLWIATTGTPYILEATGGGSGSNSGELTFTNWDQGTLPTPPAGAVPASSITTTTIAGGTGATGTTGGGTTGATGTTGGGTTGGGTTGGG